VVVVGVGDTSPQIPNSRTLNPKPQVVVVGVGDSWRAMQAEAALRRIGLLSPDGFGTRQPAVSTSSFLSLQVGSGALS
jgi:hypothetical protein